MVSKIKLDEGEKKSGVLFFAMAYFTHLPFKSPAVTLAGHQVE